MIQRIFIKNTFIMHSHNERDIIENRTELKYDIKIYISNFKDGRIKKQINSK
jgi:hypothetical protein